MNTLVISLVVLSAITHAFRDFLTKKANDKQVFIWLYGISGLIFFLPLFIYFLFREGLVLIGFYISVASGFVLFFYFYFLSKALEKGELSHVYPIIRSSPALVVILAIIFLKEQVSILGISGIALIVLGTYTINMKKMSLSELFLPIKLISKDTAIQFAFLTLIALAVSSIIDKIGVSYVSPFIYIYLITLFTFIFFTIYIFHNKNKLSIKNEWKTNKKIILISGFFMMFSYLLILIAFTIEKVSYVTGLRQLSVIFAVILGGFFLKEKHKLIRFSAAALIFIGAVLISIAN
jgi:uncharacterized membrane protein